MACVAKFILKLLAFIIVLLVILAIGLVVLVNPERLKPYIVKAVADNTGRTLAIDGKLSWAFFPTVGINVGHLTLSNPAGFNKTPFLEVQHAELGIAVMPLLHGAVQAGSIQFEGVAIHLQKNAAGHVNWSFANPHASAATVAPKSIKGGTGGGKSGAVVLAISALKMTNATLSYADDVTHKSFALQHVNFSATDINTDHPFPMQLALDATSSAPVLHAHMTLSAEVQPDLAQDTLSVVHIKEQLANIRMTGSAHITQLRTAPAITGQLTVLPFDLREFLQTIGAQQSALQQATGVRAAFNLVANSDGVHADGDIHATTLQAAKLTLHALDAKLRYAHNVLAITPLMADVYQGKASGHATIKLGDSVPHMAVTLNMTQVNMAALMSDLRGADQKFSLTGTGNVRLDVTTAGAATDVILRNLNGNAQLAVTNGYVTGVDIGHLVDVAGAFVNKQPQPTENSQGRTPFGSLTGTAKIMNGVMSTSDIQLQSPRFTVTGGGTVDLPAQSMDMALNVAVNKSADQKNNLANLYGEAIPLRIHGPFSNLSKGVDQAALSRILAKRAIRKVVDEAKDRISKDLGGKLPGNAGAILDNLLGR